MLHTTLLAATLLVMAPQAQAPHVPLPPVNLGGSSITDGVAGPGVFGRAFFTASTAPRFYDAQGRPRPGDHSLSTLVAITHAGFLHPRRMLGAYWGADVLVPVSHLTVHHDGTTASATGLGDLVASPLVVQWPTSTTKDGRPWFASRLAFTLVFPTGAYDRRAPLSPGSGVVGIDPYYAFTFLITPRLETSGRLHYSWSAPNPRPPLRYEAERVQPGQAFHVNAAISYAVVEPLRIGIAGYALLQTTDAKIDGRSVMRSSEAVAALGPGLKLSRGGLHLTLNAFWELAARERPAGFRAGLSLVKVFALDGPRASKPRERA